MRGRTIRTSEKRDTFLAALAQGLSVTAACDAAGFGKRSVYDWRNDDEEFRADWDRAVEAGTDLLEDIAIKRASESSDTLLIFMLKARRPDKFKDRAHHEHTGKDGGPIQTEDVSARDTLLGRVGSIASRSGANAGNSKPH